jgi:hypothetical protein
MLRLRGLPRGDRGVRREAQAGMERPMSTGKLGSESIDHDMLRLLVSYQGYAVSLAGSLAT